MKIKVTCLILLTILFGCEELTKNALEEEQVAESLRTPKNIVLFCDMTTSLDSISISTLAQYSRRLINELPWGSKIEVYPINNSTFSKAIFKEEIAPFPESGLTSDVNKAKKLRYIKALQLEKEILKRYGYEKKDTINQYQSCIITSLESIHGLLKSRKDNKNTHVVFFSDMVEQCLVSSAGPIYMCTNIKNRRPDKKEILQKIEKKYNPDFNLKDLIDNRISIVITSDKKEEHRCLLDKDLKEIWQRIFEKVGYSKEDFISFHFNQGLPNLD